MIIRFAEKNSGIPPDTASPTEIAKLLANVADMYPTAVRKLEHVVWRYTSGRPHLISVDATPTETSAHYVSLKGRKSSLSGTESLRTL